MRVLAKLVCLRMSSPTSILLLFAFALFFSVPILAEQQSPLGEVLQGPSNLGRDTVTGRDPNPNPGVTTTPAPESAPSPAVAPPPVVIQLPTASYPSTAPAPSQPEGLTDAAKNIGSVPIPPPPQGRAPAETKDPKYIQLPDGPHAPSNFSNTTPQQPNQSAATTNSPTISQQQAVSPKQPGGVSLSRAAADGLPLSLSLDGAYYKDGILVLTGAHDEKQTLDAPLFLTALRLACEPNDPYFSLDPVDGAAWLQQGYAAEEFVWPRVKEELQKEPVPDGFAIQTFSVKAQYPSMWKEIQARYPELRTRLVFGPEWLKATRFGEILYKADVLLKELVTGVSLIRPGVPLRADRIAGYAAPSQRNLARTFLLRRDGQEPVERQAYRLWFDLAPSVGVDQALADPDLDTKLDHDNPPGLYSLLRSRGFVGPVRPPQVWQSGFHQDGGIVEISRVFPRMYVRRHDAASGKDVQGHDPDLDWAASHLNAEARSYANAYEEFQALIDIFRAYVVSLKVVRQDRRVCGGVRNLPLTDREKVSSPMPEFHASELFFSKAAYAWKIAGRRQWQLQSAGQFSGGVGLRGRAFFASSQSGQLDTAIIEDIKAGIQSTDHESTWRIASGRQFIALGLDRADVPPEVSSATKKYAGLSKDLPTAGSLPKTVPYPLPQPVIHSSPPSDATIVPPARNDPPSVSVEQKIAMLPPVRPPVDCRGVQTFEVSIAARSDNPLTTAEECSLKTKDSFKECPNCPKMIAVASGSYQMGLLGYSKSENPSHPVDIKQPFAVGRYAVTFEEWDACVADGGCNRYSPSDNGWGRGRRPVINISWNDAKAYVEWLQRTTRGGYRLLTEAEREYVTLGDDRFRPYWWGRYIWGEIANFNDRPYRKMTVPVDTFDPNPKGLYQVHGNVWEWVEDCRNTGTYDGAPRDGSAWLAGNCNDHVIRGGAWNSNGDDLRATRRVTASSNARFSVIGFRVGRTLN
jgi:formylglycine-generating enzyme required for sulfatase activity